MNFDLLQLYMSNQSEEQQKFGERVAYLQEATNKHNEAMKMSKVTVDHLISKNEWNEQCSEKLFMRLESE